MIQLKEAVINQGLSYPQYLNNIRDEVLISKLVDQMVRRKVDVSEEEIDNYILQHPAELQSNHRYDLSHLLVLFLKVPRLKRSREVEKRSVRQLNYWSRGLLSVKSPGAFQMLPMQKKEGTSAGASLNSCPIST